MGKDVFLATVFAAKIVPRNDDTCYLDDFGWGCGLHVMQYGNLNYPKTAP